MKILIVEDQFIEAYDLQLILEKAGYTVTGIAHSAAIAEEMVADVRPDLVCLDIFLKGEETGIDLAKKLRNLNIGFVYISANSSSSILNEAKMTNPYGFIVKPFREQDILTTLEIACYRHDHNIELLLQHVSILQKNIDAISYATGNTETALVQLGTAFQTYIPFDYMECGISTPGNNAYNTFGIFRRNYDNYQIISPTEFANITKVPLQELTKLANASPPNDKPVICEGPEFVKTCHSCSLRRLVAESFGIRSMMTIPVKADGQAYHFSFYNRQPDRYTDSHLALATDLRQVLVKFIRALYGTPRPEPDTEKERKIMPVTVNLNNEMFEGMIGSSKAMLTVYDHIKKVAPSDTSVLILGESGTGKEKVARCIHNLSSRKDRPFVTINCGAIPEKLAESLLFGHEKGAFTGATEKQLGKFELADTGTIFLDEIGEMPIDLQVKLLRVLQENEIERIGGRNPIKINARIIAATNKNLEEEVASGRFRMDLYYRLHIFPITVPSLRERKEDIPALALHFVSAYCRKLDRKPLMLSNHSLEQVSGYNWPGNIRQLEHVIQRSIILAEGNMIKDILLPKYQRIENESPSGEFSIDSIKTIQEMEREYIYYILRKCNGKVYGLGGAAELLDIPPSTLNSKMKKLGIKTKLF